jgi:hypothetical protein
MSDDKSAEAFTAFTDPISTTTWVVTSQLRYVRKVVGMSLQRVLQQKWVSTTGCVEWIDVPEVQE